MTTIETNEALFRGIVACMVGFYALFTGWNMVHSPDRVRPMYFKLGLVITRIIMGKMAAEQRELELMNPLRIRRHGYLRILIGSLLTVSGGLLLIGLALI